MIETCLDSCHLNRSISDSIGASRVRGEKVGERIKLFEIKGIFKYFPVI